MRWLRVLFAAKNFHASQGNSRAWAWALQQNIMGLSFEHTQLILKYTQQRVTSSARHQRVIDLNLPNS